MCVCMLLRHLSVGEAWAALDPPCSVHCGLWNLQRRAGGRLENGWQAGGGRREAAEGATRFL